MISADQYHKLNDLMRAHGHAAEDRIWAAASKGVNSEEYREAQKVSTKAHRDFNEYAVSLIDHRSR